MSTTSAPPRPAPVEIRAGPQPWDAYEITPTTIYALSTDDPHGASRWRL